MKRAIVHEYFKLKIDKITILVQLNPIEYTGTELVLNEDGSIARRDLEFDENIYEDFEEDGFVRSSPIEFNLYLKGVS